MEPVEPRRESAFTVVQFSHAFPILRVSVVNPKENLYKTKGGTIAHLLSTVKNHQIDGSKPFHPMLENAPAIVSRL